MDQVRILACITFLFRPQRMSYLLQVLQSLGDLDIGSLDIVIFTETQEVEQLERIALLARQVVLPRMSISVSSHPEVGSHLRLLPWAHKATVKQAFSKDNCSYTHLLYLEEDIRFGRRNLEYFLKYNEVLKPHGVIPGFIRVEFNQHLCEICAADSPRPNGLDARDAILADNLEFVCLDEPYAAMYLLDAEQAREYIASPSFGLDSSLERIGWGEPERAAIGLTFESPPPGHRWRVVVPLLKATHVPHACSWVHHLPNTYANNLQRDDNYPMGKLGLEALFM